MILGSGSGNKTFFGKAKMTAGTSIFYDLFKNDKIGHKIISTMQCEPLDMKKTKVFMQHKMKEIVKKISLQTATRFGSKVKSARFFCHGCCNFLHFALDQLLPRSWIGWDRPDKRQSSHGRLTRRSNAKTARSSKM